MFYRSICRMKTVQLAVYDKLTALKVSENKMASTR